MAPSWLPTLHLPSWLHLPDRIAVQHILYGIIIGFSLSLTSTSLALWYQERKRDRFVRRFEARPIELRSDEIIKGVTGLIGNTPLVRIDSLSDALRVEILGKAEYLNPGGSAKDRVALKMIEDAEHQGFLHPHTGSRIFEGTVGSTGISIATVAKARGYDAAIIMPDDVAEEKVKTLLALGAEVERVRPASIVDRKQFVNLARERAKHFGLPSQASAVPHGHLLSTSSSSLLVSTTVTDTLGEERAKEGVVLLAPRGYFADQFENRANYQAHFHGTGPEIWRQTNGRVDAFVSGAGTGGTLAGTGQYLKKMDKHVRVVLADPEGSGLYNKVKHGVMFHQKEAEGTKRRHQVDTVVEGIGINRLTKNFELALPIIDDAFRITDAEAVAMSRYLVQHDGFFLGSSSACNLVAAVKFAKKMGWREGQTVVTILGDSGSRHYSKFWNDDYLREANIPVDTQIIEDLLAQPPANQNHIAAAQ
ncbi:PALP-domain-containing protein [Laetiporus sulphureus 93-53]|uniref:cysteine synthase n=1 Tax=Laetiporus sulphureus 93-53 TaxID=1314785 RepID=A0A165GWE9_9APHY|nr:PALP-domain-containing protein [Laetiporus sulphureus 93-53]KZT10918.1 PALP-domain-containing protein [Laetiporus sulphureus 93-53]